MNLQLVTTGNFVPTCDANSIHNPLTWNFCGADIRVIFRPDMPADRALAFVRSDVAGALGSKNPHQFGKSIGLIEGEDKGENRILTLGGPQKLSVLTFKGLSKLLMRSDHKKAVEFQDWLASKSSDLTFHGIAFRDMSAQQGLAQMPSSDPALTSILATLAQAIIEMPGKIVAGVVEAMRTGSTLKPIRLGATRSNRDLPMWTIGEHSRLRNEQFNTAGGFLTKAIGRKPTACEAGSLNSRTSAYCRAHGYTIKLYYHHGRLRTYLPEAALNLVHRTGWTSKNQVFAEAQGNLFRQLGDKEAG